jgi:hypothetical protein
VSSRLPKSWPIFIAIAICCGLAVESALSPTITGDYVARAPVAGDNAAPAVNALVHGSFSGFAAHQPLMGPLSLLLRAPFVAVGDLFSVGGLVSYQLGVLACLLPVAVFAGWLLLTCGAVRLPDRSPSVGWIAGWLAASVLLIGHATQAAIQAGHPEEPLTAVLATVAVIAAIRGQPTVAGVTLGLAVATKEWALIAVAPVLVALAADRWKAIGFALAVALALTAPPAIANPKALLHSGAMLADRRLVNPLSLWWPLGQPLDVLGATSRTSRQLPPGLNRLVLAELLLVGGIIVGALSRFTGSDRLKVRDPLALLALLGLIRFVGDPLPQQYYLEALLVPLAAWEVLVAGRLPLVRTTATAFVVMVAGDEAHLPSQTLSAITLACAVVLAGYLIRRVVRDPGADRVRSTRTAEVRMPPGISIAAPRLIVRDN